MFYSRILPIILLAIVAIISTYSWSKSNLALKIVAIISLLNLLTEVLGNYMGYIGTNNIWLYNISDFIRFPLWFLFFNCTFTNLFQKKIGLYSAFLFPFLWLFLCFFQSISVFQTYSFIIGSMVLLLCCFLYLFNEYKSNSTESLFREPNLWVCLGLLIYYSLNLPFIGLYNWLYHISSQFALTYFYVCVVGSSLLLNLSLIIAFLCNLKNTKSGF